MSNAYMRNLGIGYAVLCMSKPKSRWRTVGILSSLFQRIDAVTAALGYPSVSAYVNEVVRTRLREDENIVEEAKMLQAEIKERIKGDSL